MSKILWIRTTELRRNYAEFGKSGYETISCTALGYGANTDNDSAFGFDFGAGLEFAIAPRKSYFQLEAKGHLATFRDTYSTTYSGSPYSLPDLTGLFYTVTGSVMFTW